MSSPAPEQNPADGAGIRLGRALFDQVIRPILERALPELRYDAGLIGSGSEVLGFDTDRSQDHDFGARCLVFLAADDPAAESVKRLLDREVPAEFAGHPTRFTRGVEPPDRTNPPSQIIVTNVPAWTAGAMALSVTATMAPETPTPETPTPEIMTTVDWIGIPWQALAAATSGAVFHIGLGDLQAMRARLAWYPDDVWRFVLAGQWTRIAQEEPFVGRTGEVGDDLGSAILTGRLVRDLMRLAMLLRRRYPPYAKWTGSAFARLPDAAPLGAMLAGAMRAVDWHGREKHLCRAYEYVAALQNEIGICAPVDPECRQFHTRPFRVLGADRFVVALRDSITDPAIRDLPAIGSIDQIADSTDVLSHTGRARAITRALYY